MNPVLALVIAVWALINLVVFGFFTLVGALRTRRRLRRRLAELRHNQAAGDFGRVIR